MKIANIRLGLNALRDNVTSVAIAIGILAALTSVAALAQQNVDTIVTNGKILTVDADFRVVEALAIDGGRIVARGTNEEVARYAGPDTRVIDVAGATVIPGLIDNHFHLTRAVERWHQPGPVRRRRLAPRSARDSRAKAASMPAGEWIMVQGGWTPRQFADAPGGFTLEELDRVAPKNPLFVQEGYSVVYANSLALKAVGLDPADGARRNAAGLASFQPPIALLDAIPPTSPAQLEQNLTDFLHELNAAGLTGVYSLGQSDFLAARAAKGPLPVRLWETLGVQRNGPGLGDRGRGAHRAQPPESVRRQLRHLRPRRGALRAVLRSGATEGALARRDHERVRQARDRGGAWRLARPPARDQQLRP